MRFTVLLLLLSLVGTSLSAQLPYIVGGEEAPSIEYWPWMGSLHLRFGDDFVCGCSLLRREWAVTAASCVQSGPYNVRFGSVKRSEGTLRAVSQIKRHENYRVSGAYKYNDVAVLKFSPLELTTTINTVTLGETVETINSNCYFTGWGRLKYSDSTYPTYLHQAKTTVTVNANCDNAWSDINSNHVCTNFGNNYPVTCRGDTGGPLVCYKGDHFELVGISSWQHHLCYTNWYPVYTRVSSFRLWILENARTTHSEQIHE